MMTMLEGERPPGRAIDARAIVGKRAAGRTRTAIHAIVCRDAMAALLCFLMRETIKRNDEKAALRLIIERRPVNSAPSPDGEPMVHLHCLERPLRAIGARRHGRQDAAMVADECSWRLP